MIYLVYAILFFAGLQLITVLINFIFSQKLKETKIDGNPTVSVLIPARNEEKNIGKIIEDIINQSYKSIELIIFDDNSSDNTANIVSEKIKQDKRIKLLKSTELPKNWLGKNWACHNLAKNAKGDYLLFLDADVRAKSNLIKKTLAYSQKYKLGLLSIFPKQIMKTFGEKLTVPLMHYILLTLLPLIFVRKSIFKSHSAANGQFMLFDAKIYTKYLPHKLFKSEKVEDIKISRFYKSQKKAVACITGTNEITCRMYEDYNQAVNGFSKNIVMFFGNTYIFTVLFWLFNTLSLLFCFIEGYEFAIIYLVGLLLIRVFFSLAAKQNIFQNIILFYPQMIVMIIIVYKSLINKITKKQIWKERLV